MCKSLKVFHCSLPEGAEINVVRDFFAVTPLQWEEISCVNWEQYPYRPEVSFAVAHNGAEMFIQYKVKETGIRAVYEKDEGSMPWTDSCVEFFLSPDPASSDYFNLEMNCIGHGLLAKGPDRHSRTGLPSEALAAIRRHSTLGGKALSSADGEYEWTLTLAVPLSLYGIEKGVASGLKLRGNFYKCGDEMAVAHFLSWNPIGTPTPDFHCPESFGTIEFE